MSYCQECANRDAEVQRLREQMDDYQGRLWCALGQPLNIEYIEAVKQMREQACVLREALLQGLHSDCPTWMLADNCQTLWHNLARAALAATEPRP